MTTTWDGPALVNLSDVLADLYPDKDASRRVIMGVGLRPALIRSSDSAATNWLAIVEHANNQGKLDELIEFSLVDHPRCRALVSAKAGPLASVRGPDIRRWEGLDADQLEKLVSGEDALVDVSFLAIGLERAQAVARITVPAGQGSGFLVEGNRIVTNHHVVATLADAKHAKIEFNYQRTMTGALDEVATFALEPDRYFKTSAEDDWTVVGVAGSPQSRFKPLELADVDVCVGDRVNVIQHPGGQPKQLSFFHNLVAFVGADRIQYLTDTMTGSSGSPVFDRHWRVVALHHSGGLLREPTSDSKVRYLRNEGIHIRAILRGLGLS